jgi:type II secretory pathway pseudopilin PulG
MLAILLLLASPAWAQQPQADNLDQATAAQFQALATQLGNASEAVQKLIDSRKKLQQELDALKQPKVSEAPPR